MPYLEYRALTLEKKIVTQMEDLIFWGLITFLFYVFNCYVVKMNMKPDSTQKEWITLFASIFGSGILIVLIMYFAYINFNFLSLLVSPLALIPLGLALLGQLAVLKPGISIKILCSILLIIVYVLFWIVGIFAGPEISGISLYHG